MLNTNFAMNWLISNFTNTPLTALSRRARIVFNRSLSTALPLTLVLFAQTASAGQCVGLAPNSGTYNLIYNGEFEMVDHFSNSAMFSQPGWSSENLYNSQEKNFTYSFGPKSPIAGTKQFTALVTIHGKVSSPNNGSGNASVIKNLGDPIDLTTAMICGD